MNYQEAYRNLFSINYKHVKSGYSNIPVSLNSLEQFIAIDEHAFYILISYDANSEKYFIIRFKNKLMNTVVGNGAVI